MKLNIESKSNSEQLIAKRTRRKTNLNEVYVTIPTTLDPSNHIAVALVSSVLKAKRAAIRKASKDQPKFHPKLQALLERIENDDEFDASSSDIEDALR